MLVRMVPHGTKMVPYGTICYHMLPYGTIWYGTIWYHKVPYGTIWYLMVPSGHSVFQKIIGEMMKKCFFLDGGDHMGVRGGGWGAERLGRGVRGAAAPPLNPFFPTSAKKPFWGIFFFTFVPHFYLFL